MSELKNKTLREKILIAIVVVLAISFVGYKFVYLNLVDYRDRLQDEILSLGSYDSNLQELQDEDSRIGEQINKIEAQTEELKKEKGLNTINVQDFLLFLGTKTTELGIDIQKFVDSGVTEKNGIWRSEFDIELYGKIEDLIKFTESVDDLDITYDVESISVRQQNDQSYLVRSHTSENKLDWFTENVMIEDNGKDKEEGSGIYEEFTELPLEYVEETPTETYTEQTVDVEPKDINEQMEILLGIKPATKTVKKTTTTSKPKTNQHNKINTPTDTLTNNEKPTNRLFHEDKIKMDFKIVFTMFNDPTDLFMNKELYSQSAPENIKEFVVDAEGTTKEVKVINDLIKDKEYLQGEITRVMELISNSGDEVDTTLIKNYLNYLLSKR